MMSFLQFVMFVNAALSCMVAGAFSEFQSFIDGSYMEQFSILPGLGAYATTGYRIYFMYFRIGLLKSYNECPEFYDIGVVAGPAHLIVPSEASKGVLQPAA